MFSSMLKKRPQPERQNELSPPVELHSPRKSHWMRSFTDLHSKMFKTSVSRRNCLLAAVLGCLTPVRGVLAASGNNLLIADLEASMNAEIGLSLRDEDGRVLLEWRSQEAFALNSTIKALLAAWMIDRKLERKVVSVGIGGNPAYAPSFGRMAPNTQVSLQRAAEAACAVSDNRAANILLRGLGGPAEFTQWIREKGDRFTRSDRFEPELNITARDDPRDKTRPSAVSKLWLTLYKGFSPEDRAAWLRLLYGNTQSANLLRNHFPADWKVADRTGAGSSDSESNRAIHALIRDPSGKAYFAAIHIRMRPNAPLAMRDQVLSAAGKIVANVLTNLVGHDVE